MKQGEDMADCLESYNNPLIQILAEFDMFLFVISHRFQNNGYLNNALTNNRRICIRVLCDFFNNKQFRRDDLCCKDFLGEEHDLSVEVDEELFDFLNKNTFHFTTARGTYDDSDKLDSWFVAISKQLIKRIEKFLSLMDTAMSEKYKECICDDVTKLRNAINAKLITIGLANGIPNVLLTISVVDDKKMISKA